MLECQTDRPVLLLAPGACIGAHGLWRQLGRGRGAGHVRDVLDLIAANTARPTSARRTHPTDMTDVPYPNTGDRAC
jgi:hypothetical protein